MELRNELKSHNIRFTRQREAILEIIKDSDEPLTMNQIKSQLSKDIDLSTIYRTLTLFENKSLIHKIVLQEPVHNVYDYNRHQHQHHLICIRCEKIEMIEECPLGDYEERIAKKTQYTISRHQLDLYGVCPNCQ